MNIMIVARENTEQELLQGVITELYPEAELVCFSKIREAMDFAANRLSDIVLIDIEHEGRNHMNFAKELQKMYPRQNVILIAGSTEFALEAHTLYCSAYLMKPLQKENVARALQNLRYPLESKNNDIYIQCFGNFEVYHKGEPIHFRYSLTKQLLAYLVDRNGADCTSAWIEAALFDDEGHASYMKQIRKDLLDTFSSIGASELIRSGKGTLSINRNRVSCDYFDYLDGRRARKGNEYMIQYPFELL